MRGSSAVAGLGNERSGALGLTTSNAIIGTLGSGSLSTISSRGARGSSIDRGRGRSRGLYHSSLSGYPRSGFMYDEDSRGVVGRVCTNLILL